MTQFDTDLQSIMDYHNIINDVDKYVIDHVKRINAMQIIPSTDSHQAALDRLVLKMRPALAIVLENKTIDHNWHNNMVNRFCDDITCAYINKVIEIKGSQFFERVQNLEKQVF